MALSKTKSRQLATRRGGAPASIGAAGKSVAHSVGVALPAGDTALKGRTRCASRDRTARKFSLGALAQIDLLTNLSSRSQFRDRLDGAVARAKRNGKRLAIAFLDVDRFRQVNHTCGQRDADLLLVGLADRLRHCMRKSDTIARLGGDEFAVLMESLDDWQTATLAWERLLVALAAPYTVAGREVRTTVSIGSSAFPADSTDGDGLMRAADIALYSAKDQGGDRCERYSPALEADIARASARKDHTMRRMATLTPRERQVLDSLVAGKASKMIANLLGTSPRTIETHRANIMTKMSAPSLPELLGRVVEAGILSVPAAAPGQVRDQPGAAIKSAHS